VTARETARPTIPCVLRRAESARLTPFGPNFLRCNQCNWRVDGISPALAILEPETLKIHNRGEVARLAIFHLLTAAESTPQFHKVKHILNS